jgi:hypothetical protein
MALEKKADRAFPHSAIRIPRSANREPHSAIRSQVRGKKIDALHREESPHSARGA